MERHCLQAEKKKSIYHNSNRISRKKTVDKGTERGKKYGRRQTGIPRVMPGPIEDSEMYKETGKFLSKYQR